MRVPWPCAAIVALVGACTDPSGSVSLLLSLPPSGDLRPAGMTTVSITEVEPTGATSVTTTPLVQTPKGYTFTGGDVKVGDPLVLSAELRDSSSRLVGYGALSSPIIPSGSKPVSVTIPVRKPIVYVTGGTSVFTLDPTRDAGDSKYQGSLGQASIVVVPIDGTELAVVTTNAVQRFDTANHAPIGSPISISKFGNVLDAAGIPGERRLVVGTDQGIAIVDIDAGSVTTTATMKADRVVVGGTAAAGFTAYVLSGRVSPPTGTGTCSGSSTVAAVAFDAGTGTKMIASGVPIADIAADDTGVFGAMPCTGQVKRLDSGGMVMTTLQGAAALAIQNRTLWAVGSMPPVTGTDPTGARITLASVGTDGSMPRVVQLPPKSELMTYDGDAQHELSLTLHADTEIPLDIAVLPVSDQIALITRMDTHRNARFDMFNNKVIPEMQATDYDVLLADPVTGAITRIRASCNLNVIQGQDAEFQTWSCANANPNETPTTQFTPQTIAVMNGAR